MPKVQIRSVMPGDILEADVRLANGTLILVSGQKLTSSLIDRLKKFGIQSIEIKERAYRA